MLNLFKSLSGSLLNTGLHLSCVVLPITTQALPAFAKITEINPSEKKAAEQKFSEYEDLFSCIDADPVFDIHPKWDFSIDKCITGRRWVSLPNELKIKLDRPLNQAEVAASLGEMKVSSPQTIAEAGQKPRAIILIGAGASGKSSMCNHLNRWVDSFNSDDFVQFDGDILRKYHEGFQESISDESVGYNFGWQTLKPHIFATKEGILDTIIRERRNVMIPTGVHAQKYYRIMTQAGYSVSVVGVYVNYKRALYQGRNRAEYTGREYLGDRTAWETGVSDMLELSSEINLRNRVAEPDLNSFAFLVDNRDFFQPRLVNSDQLQSLVAEN